MPMEDMYSEDTEFLDDKEGEDFESLADELFPDVDPMKLKKMIRLCYEEDKKRDEENDSGMGGMGPKGGSMLVLELGGSKSKGK